MSTDQFSATFNCKDCGPTTLEIAEPVTDDSAVKCKTCQTEFGRWGDVKAKVSKAAFEHVGSELKKALGGLKGFTIK